mmetsp:Transcript_65882/g.155170  ORF Transcript_65882/g.155170 Transcript_65882/m.155170 type:complete len:201 (+) Transcript_65882:1611-2213(+)
MLQLGTIVACGCSDKPALDLRRVRAHAALPAGSGILTPEPRNQAFLGQDRIWQRCVLDILDGIARHGLQLVHIQVFILIQLEGNRLAQRSRAASHGDVAALPGLGTRRAASSWKTTAIKTAVFPCIVVCECVLNVAENLEIHKVRVGLISLPVTSQGFVWLVGVCVRDAPQKNVPVALGALLTLPHDDMVPALLEAAVEL